MKLAKWLLTLGLFMGLTYSAHARKPAVEDFVGVESESYAENALGAEVLFEFGNSVKAIKPVKATSWEHYLPGMVLGAFLFLPFAMWTVITRSANKLDVNGPPEHISNVTSLSDYAKETKDNDQDDDFKQAG